MGGPEVAEGASSLTDQLQRLKFSLNFFVQFKILVGTWVKRSSGSGSRVIGRRTGS